LIDNFHQPSGSFWLVGPAGYFSDLKYDGCKIDFVPHAVSSVQRASGETPADPRPYAVRSAIDPSRSISAALVSNWFANSCSPFCAGSL
jgi:hypothetical protein